MKNEMLLELDFGSAPMPPEQPQQTQESADPLFDIFSNNQTMECKMVSKPPEPSKEQTAAKDNLINHLGELYAASAPRP